MALTIRQTDEMSVQIKKIKKSYNIKSASKVVEKTVNEYIALIKTIDGLEVKLYEKESELTKIKNIIQRKNEADKEYNKLVEQLKK